MSAELDIDLQRLNWSQNYFSSSHTPPPQNEYFFKLKNDFFVCNSYHNISELWLIWHVLLCCFYEEQTQICFLFRKFKEFPFFILLIFLNRKLTTLGISSKVIILKSTLAISSKRDPNYFCGLHLEFIITAMNV